MVSGLIAGATRAQRILRRALSRLDVLAIFPLLILVAHEIGDASLLLATSLLLPALLALQSISLGHAGATWDPPTRPHDSARLPGRQAVLDLLERTARMPHHESACILLEIDDWRDIADRWGAETSADIALHCLDRLRSVLRHDDVIAKLGDARFAIALAPVPAARLGIRDGIVSRLRAAIAEPMAIDGTSIRITASVGHAALLRDTADPAGATMDAAEAALADAHGAGVNSVRAFAPGMLRARRARARLTDEVEGALASGDIRAWFQPQVRARTDAITGFEALARWHHPRLGVLGPADFLGAIVDAGQMQALGQKMLRDALAALQDWDLAGLNVPTVSVNFSAAELRDPSLAERIRWDLDRFDLRPDRLVVEILETVAAQSTDDVVIATLSSLGSEGVRLDLDDFGIGQASLAAVRRFGVSRFKIDRSFVIGIDHDPEQQSMVAAILAMARELGVDALAEGVETAEERVKLVEMGCTHLQGFAIARPMPRENVIDWIIAHNAALACGPGRSDPRTSTAAAKPG
ncbi:GGDEF domain-containing phosphodiesterase [Maritalea mobilis]|uniref:GGDEF domain-containing phosphodiesterase n=1 Tax=Maritalea mobilis TaxID=483324 RepID=UPI001C964A10|nr:GGDEF domain-containing phosphodiesterase [Maritalea mobilis]MBY6202056.1 GGDEF domain-containing phosphodiesterase [Maritalea mobilis]